MHYQTTISIPANTAATSPIRSTVQMSKGTISKVEIVFPPGCAGLVHLQILHKEHILYPSSPDESYVGDKDPIVWSEDFPLVENPYELIVIGWNYDTRYAHSPIVRFEMLSKDKSLADYLQRIFGASDIS